MNSVSPVFTYSEVGAERIIALDQPEYFPIVSLKVEYPDGSVATLTRFRFSDQEREAIASGADLLISQPHHGQLMPLGLQLAMKNAYPLPERM